MEFSPASIDGDQGPTGRCSDDALNGVGGDALARQAPRPAGRRQRRRRAQTRTPRATGAGGGDDLIESLASRILVVRATEQRLAGRWMPRRGDDEVDVAAPNDADIEPRSSRHAAADCGDLMTMIDRWSNVTRRVGRHARPGALRNDVSRRTSQGSPWRARWAQFRRQRPRQIQLAGVEHDVERVVDDPAPESVRGRDRLTVEEHADGPGVAIFPVVVAHRLAIRTQPGDLVRAANAMTLEPSTAPEHRVVSAQLDQVPAPGQKLRVGGFPVEPGDRAVLAVGIVVAGLGTAEFIAAEDHRHPLGQDERRQ